MFCQKPPGLRGFVHLIEGLAQCVADHMRRDTLGSQFMLNFEWAIPMTLGARERPVSRKNVVIEVIERKELADGGFQRGCRKALLLEITPNFGFASRTESQIPQGQLQRGFRAICAL